jgi:hypothetical protein
MSYAHCATGGWGTENAIDAAGKLFIKWKEDNDIDKAGKLNILANPVCIGCQKSFKEKGAFPVIYFYKKKINHPKDGTHLCARCWGSDPQIFIKLLQDGNVLMASQIIRI